MACTFTACKHRVSGSLSLPSRGSFHLSLTVLCAIGHWIVFSLGGWSPLLPTGFHVSCGTLVSASRFSFSDTGLSPSAAGCPKAVLLSFKDLLMQSEPRNARIPVWALPRSLAATDGIDVSFSSSGYLDVSVPRVPLRTLWIHVRIHDSSSWGFPHSEICGYNAYLQLPAAYRS